MTFRSNRNHVRDLPTGHQAMQLKQIIHLSPGGKLRLTKKNNYQESGIKAYSASGQDGYVSQLESEGPAVILSSIGAQCGKAFYAEGKWTTLANTMIMRTDNNLCLPKYLWHMINDTSYWPRSGTAQPFISPHDIQHAWLPVPPIGEQNRITHILDKLLELTSRIQDKITLNRELLNRFRHAYATDKKAKIRVLREISSLQMGETLLSKNLTNSGIPVYSSSVTEKPFGYTQNAKKKLSAGTIVVGARGTIGHPKLPKDKRFTSTQTTITITPLTDIHPEYLFHMLYAVNYDALSTTQAVPMLTISSLSAHALRIPDMKTQKTRSDLLDNIRRIITLQSSRLQHCRSLYQALRIHLAYGQQNAT